MSDRVAPLPSSRLSPWMTDVLLAVLTALVSVGNVAVGSEPEARPPDALAYALAMAPGALLLLRRRWPVAVLVASAVVLEGYHAAGYPAIGMLMLAVAFYTVAVRGHLTWGIGVGVGLIGIEFLWRAVLDPFREPLLDVVVSGLWPVTVVAAVLLLGDGVRSRRALAAESAERLAAVERERERETQRRVAEERLRISRELHDIVAHTVTGIGVQARVVADSIDGHPEHARAAVGAMRTAIDEAMSQLRATVGVLRSEAGEPLAPVPSLAGLDDLISRVAGDLTVNATVEGQQRPLPPTVDLTAYRIIQESLTNVVRHAQASQATVLVRYQPDAVMIEVADDGRGPVDGVDGGYGIAGMIERASAIGGWVVTGGHDGGGFRVRARLPLEEGR